MMTDYKSSLPLIGMLLILLAGCAATGPVQEEQASQQDLFELRQQANQAYKDGDMKASEEKYAELVKKVPEEAELWFRLGNVYARTQRPQAAVKAYREALVREPQMSKAWYNMSIMQLRQSVYSLGQMQVYSDPDDPLYAEGRQLLEGIIDLIGKDENDAD